MPLYDFEASIKRVIYRQMFTLSLFEQSIPYDTAEN
jgi:hypothetical protein